MLLTRKNLFFFTKGDDIEALNNVMLYMRKNEHTRKLKIVTVVNEQYHMPTQLPVEIDVLDREYPRIKIDFVKYNGEFTPELITTLSKKWNIPINFMFMGSPGEDFPFHMRDFGGVRLII